MSEVAEQRHGDDELAEEQADDSSVVRMLRQKLKEAQREARDLRYEVDNVREQAQDLREPALRALAAEHGLTDQRHLAALARLHGDEPVTAEAVAATLDEWGAAFGLQPAGSGEESDAGEGGDAPE